MPVPNLDELKKTRKHQCILCGQLLGSVEKLEKHKTFHGCEKKLWPFAYKYNNSSSHKPQKYLIYYLVI